MDPVFVKGVFAFVLASLVFPGSIYLVLAMVLGWRMGYLVFGSTLFGILSILAAMWAGNALGPRGPETAWHAIGVGPELSEVSSRGETYDVGDYPEGNWEAPKEGRYLADLRKAPSPCLSLLLDCSTRDTSTEVSTMKPVMETLVSAAINPITGKREAVQEQVHGEVGLETGDFALSDIRVREEEIGGKDSIIAVARAVPSEVLRAESLEGASEGTVEEYLVSTGDRVSAGTPIIQVKTDAATIQIRSTGSGRFLSPALGVGDKIRPGIPVAIVDVTGLAGKPEPVEVAAVRVRGAVRGLAFRYLAIFLLLFAVHMGLLYRTERSKKETAMEPATA